jgi:hypothetical protein
LLDTGIFDDDRYFDVFVEYAKASADDVLMQITVINRGTEARTLHLLPTLWFQNTWAWNGSEEEITPTLQAIHTSADLNIIEAIHPTLGKRWLYAQGNGELLFTENETN